jgi:predicted dinucleotide-binding enzyme
MRKDKNMNKANFSGIVILFTILLSCVLLTHITGAQTVTSNAIISVSVTNGMSAMLIDKSINSTENNSSTELLVSSIPGRMVVVSYGTTFNHHLITLKDKNTTSFSNQGDLCSAGNRGDNESNIIYDNNESGKLHLNLVDTYESLYNQLQDNNSKDVLININY